MRRMTGIALYSILGLSLLSLCFLLPNSIQRTHANAESRSQTIKAQAIECESLKIVSGDGMHSLNISKGEHGIYFELKEQKSLTSHSLVISSDHGQGIGIGFRQNNEYALNPGISIFDGKVNIQKKQKDQKWQIDEFK